MVTWFLCAPVVAGPVPLDTERAEELPSSEVSQLAPRTERGPDHVCDDENRQDGTLHDGSGNSRPARCLPLPRSRPPGHEQRISIENRQSAGHPVHDQHDGASPFRSVRHDTKFRG